MDGCDDYELLIEMRLHGALDAEGSARLDEHLASCSACRDFQARVKRAEEAMHSLANSATREIDWDRLEREVRDKVRRYHWMPRLAALAFIPLTAVIVWATSAPGERWIEGIASFGLGLAIVALFTVKSREYVRDATQSLAVRRELLVFSRVRLDESIRRLRWARLYLPLAALAPLIPFVLHHAAMPAREMAFWIAFAVYNAGVAVQSQVMLARLRRQRMALD